MIAVVVLTYRPAPGMLAECLASVIASGDADRVIVVDNGGGGATAALPDDLLAAVEVVTAENHGFGAGVNAGLHRALAEGADAVAVLNDDVTVEPGWLLWLAAEMARDPRIGAVQPKLLVAGSEPPVVNSVGVVVGPDGAGTDLGHGRLDGPAFQGTTEIGAFTGGAVLLRAGFVRITNGFDERYFLYYEDVDLSRRGAALGWRYRCVAASVVHHRGSVTTALLGDERAFYRERNRLWAAVRFEPPRSVVRAVWLSVRRLRHEPRRVHARALVAGLRAAPRIGWERFRHVSSVHRQDFL